MSLLQFAVPITIFGYILFKISRSPIFACLLPLAFCFGEAIYIPTWSATFKIPLVPIVLLKNDVLMLLLVIAWKFVRSKRPDSYRLTWGLDLLAVGLLLLTFVVQFFAIGASQGRLYPSAIINGRGYFFFVLSILIWADILRRFTRDEAWQLLGELSLLTVAIMPLYIFSAVGMPVYPYSAYDVVFTGDAVIVRDYLTFPYWTRVAFAFYLTLYFRIQKGAYTLAALGVLGAGIALSGIRSVATVVAAMMLAVMLDSLRRLRTLPKTIVQIALMLAAFVVFASLLQQYASAHVNFLIDRIASAIESGADVNMAGRLDKFTDVADLISTIDPLFGLGFIGSRSGVTMYYGDFILGDMMWLEVLLMAGWSGVVALGAVLLVFLVNSVRLTFAVDESRAAMGLLLLLVMIWDIGRSFASESYLWFFAGGTFTLAILVVEMRNLWVTEPVTLPGLPFLPHLSMERFERNDDRWMWRRLVLIGLVSIFAILIGWFVGR